MSYFPLQTYTTANLSSVKPILCYRHSQFTRINLPTDNIKLDQLNKDLLCYTLIELKQCTMKERIKLSFRY